MSHNLPSLHQDQYHGHNPQSLEQAHQQQQQPVMDDMMEQILSMPSWNDSSGSSKIPWDYSSISAGMAGLESMVALLNTNSNENKLHPQGSLLDPDESIVLDGSALISHLKQQQQLDISSSSLPSCNVQAGIPMHRTPKSSSLLSHANNGTGQQLSSIDNRSDAAAVSSWQQQQGYVAGIPGLPLNFGKSGSIAAVTELLGKRLRDDQQPASLMENLSAISGQDGGIFSTFASTQVGRTSEQNSTQVHLSQGQPLATVSQQAAAVVRPRVRARRGQATDPHSIAERLRRERIAERMKSLQELVPNSNKTDKASMLDEIIDYVKFLQLQVKVLSMSRLGNAGAVSSFMADLPTEDSNKFLAALGQTGGAALQEGISLTERQVAKLMEEDMGSAMQYLQSKGLCLMPIHLASNMNKTKAAAGSQIGTNTTNGNAIDMKSLGLQQAMAGSTSRLGKGVENAAALSKSTVKNAEDNTQR